MLFNNTNIRGDVNMTIKLTHDQFVEKLTAHRGNEFLPLEQYKGHRTPIYFLHTVCNETTQKTPRNLIVMRTGCDKCNAKDIAKRKTHDHQWFLKQLKKRCGDEYVPLTNYINTRTEVMMLHVNCGTEFKTTPEKLLRKRKDNRIKGCPECSVNKKRTHEDFVKQVENMYPGEFTVLSIYNDGKAKIKLKHHICGETDWIRAKHFLDQFSYCKTCSKKKKKDTDEFKRVVKELVEDEYIVLGTYENAKTNILLKHVTCGNEIEMTPDNFQHDKRCKHCHHAKNSKGQRKITEIFIRDNIPFKAEYVIPDCKNIKPLPFDFAVFDPNVNELLLLIEFDGEQHKKEVKLFGGRKGFEQRKLLDKIKTNYCQENQIHLLRIDYVEYKNLEEILNEKVIKAYFPVTAC